MTSSTLHASALLALGLTLGATGCSGDEVAASSPILQVSQTEAWALPGLAAEVHVVRTEASVPHIYAQSRQDLARVQGFVQARDRFFMMDLSRRLGLGRLSEILGDAALGSDQESRGSGMRFMAQQLTDGLTPELAEYVDAFAAGINAYIDAVERDELLAPSELRLAQGILGVTRPLDLMEPFERIDVMAMLTVVLYQTSYETGDVGRAATERSLGGLFEGAAFQDLRREGALEDLWNKIEPISPVSSAAGFGVEGSELKSGKLPGDRPAAAPAGSAPSAMPRVPTAVLERLAARLAGQQKRLNRDGDAGFGSNTWAVAGSHTPDGAALLAGDGHLSLSVPSILYQIGLDTQELGGGDTHQLGLIIPGMPLMPIGTNGKVAWSQTQLMGDVTDWYAEQIELDADGVPKTSLFEGESKPIERIDESYVIRGVALLGSEGRTESWPLFVTFDGRWLADVEGRAVEPGAETAAGETIINLRGNYVIPGDMDDDGVVTAISFDYGAFDASSLLHTQDRLGHAADVRAFQEATKGLVAYSQNFAVAGAEGSILYTAYQSVPCRGYLERDGDGAWAEGSDPRLLLDGTRYGGFRIPLDEEGKVDEAPGESDPYACVVPFEETPQALDPERGYVLSANNDPGNVTHDGSLTDDPWYIGGPYDMGYRADTIDRELKAAIEAGDATVERMERIQGNHDSRLAEEFLPVMLESIDRARAWADEAAGEAEQRAGALYTSDAAAIDEAEERLEGWIEAGLQARSGVETFYHSPADDDAEAAVATMIFNAWLSRVVSGVFDDEGLPGVWHPGGTDGRLRALKRFLAGRGEGNPMDLASFHADTAESIFFDRLGTDEVEISDEIIVGALVDALVFLRSEPTAPGEGGFGTSDMSAWLWGLRHYVQFESLLADFLGADERFSAITDRFSINTGALPLADGLGAGDPRSELMWFPRHGDQANVDAGNPGLSGVRFSYGSGPVMRMVVSLQGDVVTGRNIIPGGQSALIESEHFSDQAALWLGNESLPLRFSVADVVAGAAGRELYHP